MSAPRLLAVALLLATASCAPPATPPSPPPVPVPVPVPVPDLRIRKSGTGTGTGQTGADPEPAAPLRAVFHLSDPGRAPNTRGLTNALNALKALGDEPARFVLVVHGQALDWFRRAEPDNLAAPLAALLATGKVELRVCARTLEENHWQLTDLLPGAAVVPSGTLEVLRLEREGYAYFRP